MSRKLISDYLKTPEAQNIMNDRFCDRKYYKINTFEGRFFKKVYRSSIMNVYFSPFKTFKKGI